MGGEEAYAVDPGPLAVQEIKTLHGANYFSWDPAIVLRLDLGKYDEVFTDQIHGFLERLRAALPTLYEHHCSPGVPGGFLQRVAEGTLLGHVVEHVAIELQQRAGMDVSFGKTRATQSPGIYNVLFQFLDDVAGVYAGKAAVNLINALLMQRSFSTDFVVDKLVEIRERRLLGPSTQAIVDEARSRGIPYLRLDRYNLVQLGTGRYQKRIRATVTSDTNLIAVETASDKGLSTLMLRDAAIPVPDTLITDNIEEAVAFHARLRTPVTVKPVHGTLGRGVSVAVANEVELRSAFEWARSCDETVLIQSTIAGNSFRILVIDFQFVAAVQLRPPIVVGDGGHRIAELVADLNSDPRRDIGDKGLLTRVDIDELSTRCLAMNGYTPEAVLAAGRTLPLKVSGNLRIGGEADDVTDTVHPWNRYLAEHACRIVGLNVAGVDIVAPDLRTPLSENQGAVIEVGAAPDFRPHLRPTRGESRDVAKPLVDMLFADGRESRIPIFSVTGSRGKSVAAALLAHCLGKHGYHTGLATSGGLSMGGGWLHRRDASQPEDAALVLKDPTVDCAVLETSLEGILRGGLGYEFADVGIVLNVHDDDLHHDSVRLDSLVDLAYAKSVVAEQVLPEGFTVLNADQRLVAEMRRRLHSRLVWFSRSYVNRQVRSHLRRGGLAVVVDGSQILALRGRELTPVLQLHSVALLAGNAEPRWMDSVLAAVAALFAFGLPLAVIRDGLREFDGSSVTNEAASE